MESYHLRSMVSLPLCLRQLMWGALSSNGASWVTVWPCELRKKRPFLKNENPGISGIIVI